MSKSKKHKRRFYYGPEGATFQLADDRWEIIVPCSFSWSAVLVFLLLVAWSTGVALAFYTMWNSDEQRLDMGFMVPMIVAGLFLLGLLLQSLFGKLRVRGNRHRAMIFRGIGFIGLYRPFATSSMVSATCSPMHNPTSIVLQTSSKVIRFGTWLDQDRRQFVVSSLNKVMKSNGTVATAPECPSVMAPSNWIYGLWGVLNLSLAVTLIVAASKYGVVPKLSGIAITGFLFTSAAIPFFLTCFMFSRLGLNLTGKRTKKQVNARWKELFCRLPVATSAVVASLPLLFVAMLRQGAWGSISLSAQDAGYRSLANYLAIFMSAVTIHGHLFIVRKCPDLILRWQDSDV